MPDVKQAWRSFLGWPWAGRWAAYVCAGLALVLVVALGVGVHLVRKPFPEVSGELELPGLDGEVEVIRDAHGIPQIYADTTEDLMRAQGFVHAQDRFYEMDVRRHLTAGRLSELFGKTALETDKLIRTMGWRRVAEKELAMLQPETRAALEAYADGVNAYIDSHSPSQMSLEYTLLRATGLDYHPEDWSSVDTLAWLKAMAWDLRGNMADEIERALLSVDHTPQEVEDLYPAYPYDEHAPIVNQGALVDGSYEPDATHPGTRKPTRPAYTADQVDVLSGVLAGMRAMPAMLGRGEGIGSNSWVVSGERSATGEPLLANDPHLGTSVPGIWYQIGLHCRTVSEDCPFQVSGYSFSGVPGVVIGHNADIAWGFTNLGPDVTDLFLEKTREDTWLYDGRYRPMTTRTETIEVHDGEDVQITVRETKHGPLLSDVSEQLSTVGANARVPRDSPEAGNGYAVALRWTALDPAPTADALLALNTAEDWDDFRAAAAKFDVPAQNLVYADRDGHIGYQAPGRIPIRKSGNDGSVPVAGWLPQNDWSGSRIPFDAMPKLLDPEAGFIVTANQAVIRPSYRYYLTRDWDYGYRSQRIRDLIEAEEDVSREEMAEFQLDTRNQLAARLVPFLLDVELPDDYRSDGQERLAAWDYHNDADSPGAAYFNVVWRKLLEATFHDEMRESIRPDGGSRWWRVVSQLLGQPANSWWDDASTDEVERRDDILQQAMLEASDEIVVLMDRDPMQWEWGRLHEMDLTHQTLGTSGSPIVEWLFNRDGYRVAGGGSIVNATSWDAVQGYGVTSAPSMRMVVSLADLDESGWINLTGASGHAFNDHYVDQTDLFVEGELLPWAFTREAVTDSEEDTLTLVPDEGTG